MEVNEKNICNASGNGNEKWTKISTPKASRQVTSIHRWKLIKYEMLVKNGLFHNGNSISIGNFLTS
jgi:hypothetical protein